MRISSKTLNDYLEHIEGRYERLGISHASTKFCSDTYTPDNIKIFVFNNDCGLADYVNILVKSYENVVVEIVN